MLPRAEDALSDALIAALTTWPRDGVPQSPEAWLLTTARRRLIDRARHQQMRDRSAATIELLADNRETRSHDVGSDSRRTPEAAVRLRASGDRCVDSHAVDVADRARPRRRRDRARVRRRAGDDGTTARARESQDPRCGDRVRNSSSGSAAGAPRCGACARSMRRTAAAGKTPPGSMRATQGLVDEAIWLARALKELMPDAAEVRGLLALMLHCEARRPARRSADGRFIALSEQDPQRWLAPLIDEAERELAAAGKLAANRAGFSSRRRFNRCTRSARVAAGPTGRRSRCCTRASCRSRRRSARASAARRRSAEVSGAATSLALLDAIDEQSVAAYQPYWAVRAHLLRRAGRDSEATAAFERAIELADDPAVQAFLRDRRSANE